MSLIGRLSSAALSGKNFGLFWQEEGKRHASMASKAKDVCCSSYFPLPRSVSLRLITKLPNEALHSFGAHGIYL